MNKLINIIKSKIIVYKIPIIAVLIYFAALSIFGKPRQITVLGTHTDIRSNEIASFNITVSTEDEDKDYVSRQTEIKSKDITDAAREFGIDPMEVKTTNFSLYDLEDRDGKKYWVASNSIQIKLRDIGRIEEFVNLMSSITDAEMYGPNFSVDQEVLDEGMLISKAVEDARGKAEFVAKSTGSRLGKILDINESPNSVLYPRYGGLGDAGGGIGIAPGSTPVIRSVIVTFELK
ncbi:SIMPL domain-containing protein [Patescibacteria group bacterium]